MNADIIELRITDDRSQNAERLNETVLALRKELLGLQSVRSAEQAKDPSKEGAKSGVAIIVGTLLVSIRYSAPALQEVRGFLNDWLRRNDGKRVTLKIKNKSIDITGMSEKEVERLIASADTDAIDK